MKNSDLARVLSGHDYWEPGLYHGDAENAYQQYGASEALMIVEAGLTRFPYNIELLVDALNWAPLDRGEGQSPTMTQADSFLERLISIKDDWTRDAYESVISFFLRSATAHRKEGGDYWLTKAQMTAQDYIEAFPDEEQPYLLQAKLLSSNARYSNHQEARRSFVDRLLKLIKQENNSPVLSDLHKCALACAKELMKDGDFEYASNVARIGLANGLDSEAADDLEELLLIMLLANDRIIMREWEGWFISPNLNSKVKLERQIKSYELFLASIPEDSPCAGMANLRCCIYKILHEEYFNERD